jgi:hypothetical protein
MREEYGKDEETRKEEEGFEGRLFKEGDLLKMMQPI